VSANKLSFIQLGRTVTSYTLDFYHRRFSKTRRRPPFSQDTSINLTKNILFDKAPLSHYGYSDQLMAYSSTFISFCMGLSLLPHYPSKSLTFSFTILQDLSANTRVGRTVRQSAWKYSLSSGNMHLQSVTTPPSHWNQVFWETGSLSYRRQPWPPQYISWYSRWCSCSTCHMYMRKWRNYFCWKMWSRPVSNKFNISTASLFRTRGK
jgi:hypothetical protein